MALSILLLGANASIKAQSLPVEIVAQLGHTAGVFAVAFSPDGRTVLTGGGDTTARLWDTASGRELRRFQGHSAWVNSVASSPDGRMVLTGSSDKTARIWDVTSGRELRQFTGHTDAVHSAVFSPDGRTVLTGSEDNTARLWDVSSGRELRQYAGHASLVSSVAFSPDGQSVLTSSFDKTVRLWDTASGRELRRFKGPTSWVQSARFSPDGRTVLAGDSDDLARIWDVASGRELRRFFKAKNNEVYSVAFSPDGRTVATGNKDNTARLWDAASGRIVREFPVTDVRAVAFSPDGGTLLTGSLDNTARLFDLASGRELRQLTGRSKAVQSVAFSPDGRAVLTGGLDKTAWLWDLTTGRAVRQFAGHAAGLNSVTFSPDGRTVLTGAADKTARLWDLASGRELRQFKTASDLVQSVAISPDGKMALTGCTGAGVGQLWDLASGRELRRFTGHNEPVAAVAFSPDGRMVLTGTLFQTARLWDAENGRELREFKTLKGLINSVAFSPDGRTALTGSSDDALRLWDVASGRELRQFNGYAGSVHSVTFSPDGRTILAGGNDKTARLWDTESGRELRQLIGHTDNVNSAVFSPDGQRVLTGSQDTTTRLWDALSGQLLATFIGQTGQEWIVITPEGFFSASEHGASLLSAVRGLDNYSIDQFYQSLYRPDLVREKLAGDPRGLVREAAANLDLNRVIASGSAPDVRVTLPGRSLGQGNVDGNSLSAEAEITDRGGGIGRVEWRVNGVTSGIDTPAAAAAGQPARLTRSLLLDPDENSIEVVAYNNANLIASVPARVSVTAQPAAPPIAPPQTPSPGPAPSVPVATARSRLFALVAGVNDYADKRITLAYAVSDAREVARAFKDAGGDLYQSVEVRLMTDADVTRDKLDAAFADMAGKAQPSDVFVLYLAGHGKTVDGRYYFIPRDFVIDGEFNDKNINIAVKSKAIAQDQLQRWFASVPARKSVILFDTCDSGTLTGDIAETQQLEKGAANDRLAQATGRSIITASGGSQEALEGYRGHGLFTYELLDGIGRADTDGTGTVEVTELAAFVYAQVSELSQKVFRQRQAPQMKITTNYPLAKQTRILQDEVTPLAAAHPTFQLAQTTPLQIQPDLGGTVVRSLSAKMAVSVLESRNGWSLIASDGKLLGYVATRDLAPVP